MADEAFKHQDYIVDGFDYGTGAYKFLIDYGRGMGLGIFFSDNLDAIEIRKWVREKSSCSDGGIGKCWLNDVGSIINVLSGDYDLDLFDIETKRKRKQKVKRTRKAINQVIEEIESDGGVLKANRKMSDGHLDVLHGFESKQGFYIFDDSIIDLMNHLLERLDCLDSIIANRRFHGIKEENILYASYAKSLAYQFCFSYGVDCNFNKIIMLCINLAFTELDNRVSEKNIYNWVMPVKKDFYEKNKKNNGNKTLK